MALTAFQTFYTRVAGVETNGCGFDPSQTAGMLTNGAATNANTASPVVTSASYNFVAGDAGKWLYIASGTNWIQGYYLIASVAASAATLSVACATVASPTSATFTMNYADADSPFLSLTDLVSTASTTVTSAAALFTPVMVGNMIRLASATGTPVADAAGSRYLCITTYTNTTTVVLDKVSGTYTLGIAKVGGASAFVRNYTNGGTGTAPILTTPLAAGHRVYIRSAASSVDPALASIDYDHSGGYYLFPAGDTTTGNISFIGLGISEQVPLALLTMPLYKPLIKFNGLFFYGADVQKNWNVINIKGFVMTTPTFTTYGLVAVAGASNIINCTCDQNGQAATLFSAGSGSNNVFLYKTIAINTGGGTASTQGAIVFQNYGCMVIGCLIKNVRGIGVDLSSSTFNTNVIWNIFSGCGFEAIKIDTATAAQKHTIIGNTIYNGAGDGISTTLKGSVSLIINNTVSKIPTGKFAINVTTGTAAANALFAPMIDYNNVFLDGGAGSLYNNITTPPHNINLDPTFTNAGTGDFTVGTNMKAVGVGYYPLGADTLPISYMDIGAAQRVEPSGGGSGSSFSYS